MKIIFKMTIIFYNYKTEDLDFPKLSKKRILKMND